MGPTAGAEVLTVDDESRWRELLPAAASVFGSVEFARIRRDHAGVEPRLFAFPAGDGHVVHPLLLSSTASLALGEEADRTLFDAATPQYSGPFSSTSPSPADRDAFSEALGGWCAGAGVVTEFDHLHPWKARTELLDPDGIEHDREIVYVDVTRDPDTLWGESFTHACRKNVNRARREGVRVFAATSEGHARELHRIYELTMDRQGALDSYYLPPEYFVSFLDQLPGNSRILLAELDGRVIAATLYLHDDTDAYSYLGGADHEVQHARPTNAIVHEMIRWTREQGLQRLVLGGGYAPNDGIMRFKASFSPLRADFRVYRHVHLRDEYAGLRDAWRRRHGGAAEQRFFPPYRAEPAPPEPS
jgi:serine/alanine adding enzyme